MFYDGIYRVSEANVEFVKSLNSCIDMLVECFKFVDCSIVLDSVFIARFRSVMVIFVNFTEINTPRRFKMCKEKSIVKQKKKHI